MRNRGGHVKLQFAQVVFASDNLRRQEFGSTCEGSTFPAAHHMVEGIGADGGRAVASALAPFAQVGIGNAAEGILLVAHQSIFEDGHEEFQVQVLGVQCVADADGQGVHIALRGKFGGGRHFSFGLLIHFGSHGIYPRGALARDVLQHVVAIHTHHGENNLRIALYACGRSSHQSEVRGIFRHARGVGVAIVAVERQGDEEVTVEADEFVHGLVSQGAVGAVHAGKLFQHHALGGRECQHLDALGERVFRFVELQVDGIAIHLAHLQRQRFGEDEVVFVAGLEAQPRFVDFVHHFALGVAEDELCGGVRLLLVADVDDTVDFCLCGTHIRVFVGHGHVEGQLMHDLHVVDEHRALRLVVVEESNVYIFSGKVLQAHRILTPVACQHILLRARALHLVVDQGALGADFVDDGSVQRVVHVVALPHIHLQAVGGCIEPALALEGEAAQLVDDVQLRNDEPVVALAGWFVHRGGTCTEVTRVVLVPHGNPAVSLVVKAQCLRLAARRVQVVVQHEEVAQAVVEVVGKEQTFVVGDGAFVSSVVVERDQLVARGGIARDVGDGAGGNFHAIVHILI